MIQSVVHLFHHACFFFLFILQRGFHTMYSPFAFLLLECLLLFSNHELKIQLLFLFSSQDLLRVCVLIFSGKYKYCDRLTMATNLFE